MLRAPGRAAAVFGVAASILHVGSAAADEVRGLSLAEAVRTAIASDAELYIAREDTRAAAEGIALARSAFAPRLFGELSVSRDAQPPSAATFEATDAIVAATLGFTGRVEASGLTYTLSATAARHDREDAPTTVYERAHTTGLRAELVQPLWRGAFARGRRPIVVASLRREQSEHELRAQIERTVGAVETAYWNLVRARTEREARRSAVQLAKEQVEESRRLVKLGSGSDLDVLEAESGVSRRTQELLRTEQDVIETEGQLFAALGVRPGERGWIAGQTLEPTDTPALEASTPSVDEQLAIARKRRGEVLAARRRVDAERAELAVADDRRRAALDLVAAAGTVGFAGTFAMSPVTAGITPDPAYAGGFATAAGNTFGGDLHVFLGLRFEVPLGDDETEVRHALQERAVARARLTERGTLAQIESEVRTTVARVTVTAQLVQAADRAVVLAEKLLEGTRKRFRAGASTSFDVLRVSEELTRARVEAARARADYRVSLTRLAAATGTLLDGLGIGVGKLGPTPR